MNPTQVSNRAEQNKLYHAYLLRLWCADESEMKCWRASIEDTRTGERIGFASLEELFAFLMEQSELDSGYRPSIRVASGAD